VALRKVQIVTWWWGQHKTTSSFIQHSGVASVTKCCNCTGFAIIFIGGSRNNTAGIGKTFHCNVCNGTFPRYTSLWICSHLHSGDKPFKCGTCGLTLQRHLIWRNMRACTAGKRSPQVSDLTSVNSAIRQLWEIWHFWTMDRSTGEKLYMWLCYRLDDLGTGI